MPKALLATLMVLASILAACNTSSGNQAENAGKALADAACLLFDESIEFAEIPDLSQEIIKKYDFSSSDEIDNYLEGVKGTEEMNEVMVAAREQLEAQCGSGLASSGLSAAELAESIVSQ